MEWRFEIQWRGPFSHRMYPITDCELRKSRCSGGLDGSGSDESWGTHLALVSVHSLFGGSGKLREVKMSFDCCVVKLDTNRFTLPEIIDHVAC